MWVKVLTGWADLQGCTLPQEESRLLIHAIKSMQTTSVLQHPRVAVSSTRSPPKLWCPARKKPRKFERAQAIREEHERTVSVYREQGWSIVYPDGSSEQHPEVGRVGGYGVYFGDERDTAEFIPTGEAQTNIRGELRASLCALEKHRPGEHMLICPDCALVVKGMLGWAQKWRRHNWCNAQGPIQHRDMWEQLLRATEALGEEITPSHIDIPGNTRADHLADVGRRKSPLLFGHISARPRHPPEPEPMDPEEDNLISWQEWQPEEDPPPPTPSRPAQTEEILQKTPQRPYAESAVGIAPSSPPLPASPLWDIEVCTPVRALKRQRLHTPAPFSALRAPKPEGPDATPREVVQVATPHYVGPVHMNFHTPQTRSPMTPRVSQRLLESLELVLMEDDSDGALSARSAVSDSSGHTTLTCSTEGSRCVTPPL